MNLLTPEPYRVWEYYNQNVVLQKHMILKSTAKAYVKLINLKLDSSREELVFGKKLVDEVKEKTGKDKIVVFQPYMVEQ